MKQAPVLSDKQVKKLFNSPKMTKHKSRNRLILSLSYYAGLRSIEICSLCVGDVLNGDGSIKDTILLKSHQTKGNESHTLVLSAYIGGRGTREICISAVTPPRTTHSTANKVSEGWVLFISITKEPVQTSLSKCRI